MASAELRTWFVRDIFDALERERGHAALDRLLQRLPERLHSLASIERLRSSGPLDTLLLDEAEELLLGVDAALGDGSGRVLESIAVELFSRVLAQRGSVVRAADVLGTMARLRAAFERPFIGEPVMYDLVPTETGFSLTVGVLGRPRCARLLRPLAIAAIKTAHRFARDNEDELKIFAETLGDRTSIAVHYRRVTDYQPPVESTPPVRRSSRTLRPVTQPTLSAEVERILGATRTTEPPLPSVKRRRISEPEIEITLESPEEITEDDKSD